MSLKHKIGVIGGSGFDGQELIKGAKPRTVKTHFGSVKAYEKGRIVFVLRHGEEYLAPHRLNARAYILALKKCGAKSVLATAACGSLRRNIRPGSFLLLADFMDFTKTRIQTFYPELSPVYVDMSEPYDPRLRKKIEEAARKLRLKLHKRAVYACVEGPRYETKTEIKAFQKLGCDVVGMTQMPEVVLAAEAGLPYAAIAVATNYAAGMQKKVQTEEVLDMMQKKKGQLSSLISLAIGLM